MANQIKTVFLLAALGALLVLIGGYIGGRQGATLFLIIRPTRLPRAEIPLTQQWL
jgi:hypothetical protein